MISFSHCSAKAFDPLRRMNCARWASWDCRLFLKMGSAIPGVAEIRISAEMFSGWLIA